MHDDVKRLQDIYKMADEYEKEKKRLQEQFAAEQDTLYGSRLVVKKPLGLSTVPAPWSEHRQHDMGAFRLAAMQSQLERNVERAGLLMQSHAI
ncbi:hypothetical protein NC652_000462 [Populus alba x Populus x berolinensis]|nr:hypothetical protein NC652_000462 [Populus alba x Populus x berolinensis]